jgi:hypothetical protein
MGVGAGWVALRLAAPRLPVVDLERPGPPLELAQAWAPVAVVLAAVAGALLLIAFAGAALETRTPRSRR